MTRALRRTPHRAAAVASRTTRLPAAGFTLVEVIVAIVLLGVGLMGLAALSTTVTRANVQSSSLTTATALAQERAERLRTQDYDAVVSGGDTRMVDNVAYTRSWTVTTDDPAPGLKTVAIAVSWTTRGVTHTTRLSTIRGRR
jgi:type IV pilus assembly protein PilV